MKKIILMCTTALSKYKCKYNSCTYTYSAGKQSLKKLHISKKVKKNYQNNNLDINSLLYKNLVLILLLVFPLISVWSQCATAGSVTTTITTTPNTCAGNGTIKATFNSATNTTIQLIKAGTIQQSVNNPVSPHTFSNLQPGTDYQIKIICSINNTIVYSNNSNINVANNYVPITDANITISNICTNFTQGGTFTVNSVVGGTPTYQYSVIQSNDPAYSDNLSNYSTNNILNVTAFGTFQIRIKDACGNYKTFTKTISADLPALNFSWKPKKICGTNQSQGHFWYATSFDGMPIVESDFLPKGLKLVIRDKNASGAILYNGYYTGTPFTYTESASHIYHVTTTNSCGLSSSYVHNLTGTDNGETEAINAIASTSGCGASETMTISARSEGKSYWNYPINVTVRNLANTVVYNNSNFIEFSTWSTSSLPLGTYTVTYVDACGDTKTETVNNPQSAGVPVLSFYGYSKWRCGTVGALTQNGATQLLVQITGYLADRNNAVVKIISGPSNVGVNGTLADNQYWGWTNILPGTYVISYTSCGVTKTGTVTVPLGDHLLSQSLSSTATSFCSAGGTITSNKNYTGAYNHFVELLNSSGIVVTSNITGTFNNIAAGTYSTRIRINTCNGAFYYVSGSTVTITNAITGSSITSAVGVICEDIAGTPTSLGTAYIDINGVAPYTVTYRIQGSGSAYTTISNISSSSIVISNLKANTIYEVNLSDSCGSKAATSVQIKTMGNLSSSNTSQPCVGSPYALSMPYYSGAVYEWKNLQGVVVSNTRIYSIANYNSSYDGTYVCEINWGNCVTRFVNVTVNSALCGGTIDCGTIDSDSDGIFNGCDLDDDNDGILDTNECGGVEKITNGNFENAITFTGWTKGGSVNGWQKSTGGNWVEVINDAVGDSSISQTLTGLEIGKSYTIIFQLAANANAINPKENKLTLSVNGTDYYSQNATDIVKEAGFNYVFINKSITFTAAGTSANVKFLSTVTGSGVGGKDVQIDNVSLIICQQDTDGDGILDYLDLDSDNDGCLDAIEGAANFTEADLVAASGTLTVGFGSSAANQNLGNAVNLNGIPTIANGGQGIGLSQNALLSGCYCTQPGLNGVVTVFTQIGISDREGIPAGWPGTIPNGFMAIESQSKGFVVTRIQNENLIADPKEAMLIYDIDAKCVKMYYDSQWHCLARSCNE